MWIDHSPECNNIVCFHVLGLPSKSEVQFHRQPTDQEKVDQNNYFGVQMAPKFVNKIPKWTPKGASHVSLPWAFKVTRRTVARRAPKAELNSNLEPLGSISAPFPATIRAQKFVTIATKSKGLGNSTQQSQREPIGRQKDANTRQ